MGDILGDSHFGYSLLGIIIWNPAHLSLLLKLTNSYRRNKTK